MWEEYVSNPTSQGFNQLLVDHGDNLNPEIYKFVDYFDRNQGEYRIEGGLCQIRLATL